MICEHIYIYMHMKGDREHAFLNSWLIIALARLYKDRYVDNDGPQRMVVDGAEPMFLLDRM